MLVSDLEKRFFLEKLLSLRFNIEKCVEFLGFVVNSEDVF